MNGDGSRRSHRQKKLFTAPGPSRSQMFCHAAAAAQERNPLSKASYSIPAFSNCRLAHSWPFNQSQIGYGAYELVFQKAPPQSASHR